MNNPRPLMVSLDRGNRATSKPANLISQAVSRGGFRITHAQTACALHAAPAPAGWLCCAT